MSKNTMFMNCFFCRTSVTASRGVKAVLCSNCVQRLSGSPATIGRAPKRDVDVTTLIQKPRKVRGAKKQVVAKVSAGWGRGWHLKKTFVAPDGKTYSFGELITSDNS
jgi:LSD1 subclass zinc finger protein